MATKLDAEALLADLRNRRTERLDALDLPGSWSPRERETYVADTRLLDVRVRYLRDALSSVTFLEERIATTEAAIREAAHWSNFLDTARQTLCDELLALSPVARTRAEYDRVGNLRLSITTIDRGAKAMFNGVSSVPGTRLAELMETHGYVPDPTSEQLRPYGGLPWRGGLKEVARELETLTAALAAAKQDLAAMDARLEVAMSNDPESADRARLAALNCV